MAGKPSAKSPTASTTVIARWRTGALSRSGVTTHKRVRLSSCGRIKKSTASSTSCAKTRWVVVLQVLVVIRVKMGRTDVSVVMVLKVLPVAKVRRVIRVRLVTQASKVIPASWACKVLTVVRVHRAIVVSWVHRAVTGLKVLVVSLGQVAMKRTLALKVHRVPSSVRVLPLA